MTPQQLPTAPAGSTVVLDGAFFNRLMGIIAAMRISVTPPLTLNEGPGGLTISVLQGAAADGWFIITGSATKNATYTVNTFNPSLVSGFDPTASGTVAQSDVGATGSTGYAINAREVGQSTHDLASSSFLPLLFRGLIIGSYSSHPVYLFDGYQWEDCA